LLEIRSYPGRRGYFHVHDSDGLASQDFLHKLTDLRLRRLPDDATRQTKRFDGVLSDDVGVFFIARCTDKEFKYFELLRPDPL
jgi:hypothetical protein